MYIIIKRDYPALRVSVINCEMRAVIYTFFKLFGSEKDRLTSAPLRNLAFEEHSSLIFPPPFPSGLAIFKLLFFLSCNLQEPLSKIIGN